VSLICPLKHTMVSLPVLPQLNKYRSHSDWGCSEGATSDLNVQTSALIGVLNNWLFFIPTSGRMLERLPALSITRCEMTGPTFVGIH